MSLARSAIAALSLLLLAAPSVAQEQYDWDDYSFELPNDMLRGVTIEAERCCVQASNGKRPQPDEAAILKQETVLLKQLDGRASRNDKILRLALEDGRTLKFADTDPGCRYVLFGWWPMPHYYIVRCYPHAGYSSIYLISAKTGAATRLNYAPQFVVLSPSKRYAIAFISSPVVEVVTQMIDLATDPPKVAGVARPNCAGFDGMTYLRPMPVWVDDSHVRFEGDQPWPSDAYPHVYTGKVLLRVGPGPNPGQPQWEC